MKRREFLKTSATLSALTALGSASLKAAGATATTPAQEFYELRAYRLADPSAQGLLDGYLQHAAIPALNRLGVEPVGAFTEQTPKEGPAVYLLLPYPTIDVFLKATHLLDNDASLAKAGADYLGAPKSKPAFTRIDSWLLLAFAGMPRLEQPDYSRDRKPRLFELRTYESHSEAKALKKIEMFNAGEIETMREVGLGPIFFGQALVGANLPHLAYLLSAEDTESHRAHWAAFGKHPVWQRLKNDPQYEDTVSNIKSQFLRPTDYSQI